MLKSLLLLPIFLFCISSIEAQVDHPEIMRLEALQNSDLEAARDEAKSILKKIPKRSGEFYHYTRINLAKTLWKLNDFDSALVVIDEVPISKLPKERLKVHQLVCKGDVLDLTGKSDEALSIYLKALSIAKRNNFQREIASSHNNIGTIYLVRKDYPNARLYLFKALKTRKALNDSVEMAKSYANLGSYFRRTLALDSARIFYNKCVKIREGINDLRGLNSIYLSIAILNQVEGKRAEAIKTYQNVIQRAKEIKDYEIYVLGHVNMANAYYFSEDYASAEKFFLKALEISKTYNDERSLSRIYKGLSLVYEKKGNASEVLKFSKLYHSRYAEIFNIEREKEVNRLQIKFDSKEKDHQISELERARIEDDLILKEKELKTKNTLFWVYISIIILALTLVFILIIYIRKRDFSRKQKLLLDEREILLKEVHHRVKNNLQIVSSLLNLQGELSTGLNSKEILIQSQNRIQSIAIIHEKLYQSTTLVDVKLDTYIHELISYLSDSYDLISRGIEINSKVDSIPIDLDQIVPCGLIINELITNSIKHAFNRNGIISINGSSVDGKIILDIYDDGTGFPEKFELGESKSLGLKLAKGLARQLKGSLELVKSTGAHFRLTITQ